MKQFFVRKNFRVYPRTKYQFRQFLCIRFANLPLVAGCGLFGPFQLLVCDSPQALHMSVQVGISLLEVVRLSTCVIESLLSPTMPNSNVASICPTKVVV